MSVGISSEEVAAGTRGGVLTSSSSVVSLSSLESLSRLMSGRLSGQRLRTRMRQTEPLREPCFPP